MVDVAITNVSQARPFLFHGADSFQCPPHGEVRVRVRVYSMCLILEAVSIVERKGSGF